MKVLVTAVGGDIGQSVIKILQCWEKVDKIIGVDIKDECSGKHIVDKYIKVPPANSKNYINIIKKLVLENNIDFVIPINENEILRFHNSKKLNLEFQKKIIIAEGKNIIKCFDKYECIKLVKNCGLLVPETHKSTYFPSEYPFIVKSKTGSGSKNFRIINNLNEYNNYNSKIENEYLIQEYLTPSNEEYTCGVFRSSKGNIEVIILKRKLNGGLTGFAEVIWNEAIFNYCKIIAENMKLRGSINIQLINTADGPKLFEINARFSSTVIFREHLGFRDLIWSIQDRIGTYKKEKIQYNKIIGKKFYRIYTELYV